MFIGGAEGILEILPLEHEFRDVAQNRALPDNIKSESLISIIDRMTARLDEIITKDPEMGHFMALAFSGFLREANMLRSYLQDAFETYPVPPGSFYLNPSKQALCDYINQIADTMERRAYREIPDLPALQH